MISLRASRALICGLVLVLAGREGWAAEPNDASARVKVGVLVSLTGSWSSLGKNTVAALGVAAQDLAGKSGFQFLVRDTKLDPARALKAIKALHRQGVRIVIGPQSSAEVAMIKPFADAHQMLVISQGSTASSLALRDNVFRFCPNDRREAPAVVALMRRAGIRAIVPLWRNDRGNNGLHDSVKREFEAAGGTVAAGYRYETTTTDFSTATNTVAQQIDALVTAGTPQSQIAVYCSAFDEVVDVFHRAQSVPTLTTTAWYGSDGVALSAALTGDAAAAAFAANAGYPNPTYGLKDSLSSKWRPVARAIQKRTGIAPDAFAVSVYDALFVTSDALQKTNGIRNFSRFKAAFLRQSRRFSGVTGSTALDATGDRQGSDFDFWAVRFVNGSYGWVRTGTYHDGILTVF